MDNDTESNLYRTYTAYSPIVPHDWMLHHKEKKSHSFSDFDEFEFNAQSNHENYTPFEPGIIANSLFKN